MIPNILTVKLESSLARFNGWRRRRSHSALPRGQFRRSYTNERVLTHWRLSEARSMSELENFQERQFLSTELASRRRAERCHLLSCRLLPEEVITLLGGPGYIIRRQR